MSQSPTIPAAAAVDAGRRRYFELSPEMLCTIGFDGRFVEVNQSFASALGSDKVDLLGHNCHDFVHPDDVAVTLLESTQQDEPHEPVCFENRYRHADGEYRWLSWRMLTDQEFELMYCVVRDTTEAREQAAVVAKLLAELERSNTDLAQFAYVASHDLSEPLRMVSSYVQLLANRYVGQLDSDADEFIGYAVDGATRMKVLIDDLLTYSRAGGTAIIRRPVNCAALVAAAIADLHVVIVDSNATVVVEELPTVVGDPGQLAQLFQNLLSNSLKFVSSGVAPEVRVWAERLGTSWCFSVEDNGIGIAEAHRERIFLMFKRLHGRDRYPGTGIGLALCQKIVSRFGGRIWLESRGGTGTVFRFSVPDATPSQGSA
jgi:PAS domain S-box-containing protein